jgi:hypothetical protein
MYLSLILKRKMRKRIKYIHLFFSLAVIWLAAQTGFGQLTFQQKRDSLHDKFVADSAHIYRDKKIKPTFSIDKRNSFIHTSKKISVNVNGFQLGVDFKEKHSFGLGFYSVLNTQTRRVVDDNRGSININLKIAYSTIFYEYLWIDTKRWAIGIPLEIGVGNYQTTATDSLGRKVKAFADTLKRGMLILGAGVNIDFKIWQWLGINAMGGYRLVGGNEPNKVNFNGVFYSFGLQVYFGELIKMARVGIKRTHYWHQDDKLFENQNRNKP